MQVAFWKVILKIFLSRFVREEGSYCSYSCCCFKKKISKYLYSKTYKSLKYILFFLVGMGNYPVLGLNDLEHEEKHSLKTLVSVFLSTRNHIAEDLNLHGCRCQNCITVFVLQISSFDSGSINIRPFYPPPPGVKVLVHYSQTLSNR